jgi:hypothetical protein
VIDDRETRHHTANAVIRSVAIKTGLLVGMGVVAGLFYSLIQQAGPSWWFLAGSILFGGALGLLNFRWLAFAVERRLSKQIAPPGPSNPAIAILNAFKLSAIFLVLFIVIKWQVVHVIGLVIGLSLSFAAIIWEGLTFIGSGACEQSDRNRRHT